MLLSLRVFTIILLLLTACSASPVIAHTAITPLSQSQAISSPTQAPLIAQATSTPSPTLTPTADGVCEPAEDPTTRYMVVADIDYAAHTVFVSQRIRYINQHNETLSEIVLNIAPNRIPNVFQLEWFSSDQQQLDYIAAGQRFVVQLPQPVQAGCEITLTAEYTLNVPFITSGSFAAKGYFSYTERQMNLGHWLATVAVRQGIEWISREPSLIGEQEVLNPADWNVTLNLIGANQIVTIAAPGEQTIISPTSHRYTFTQARDFPVSLSDQFRVNAQVTGSDVRVELYSLDTPASPNSAAHALDVGSRSMELYQTLFGDYPYTRMLIVQGDFRDGMEFSGLVYVGDNWFTTYAGGVQSYLTLITVHEVSHQWWYAQVGNDAALLPWLDEALATYSEYLFIEAYYPDLTQWWWDFRVNAFGPIGTVNSTVYEFASAREYINAVYLRGVRMLHEVRAAIGDEAFMALLHDYAAAGKGQIVNDDLFWSLLTSEQLTAVQTIRDEYFR